MAKAIIEGHGSKGTAAVALAGLAAGLAVREKAPKRALQTAFAILVFAVALWMVLR